MRRSAAILALVLLTLSLVLGSAAVNAKPGGGNSPNAKDCQKGKWDDLATREDRGTAFTSETACVSYAAMGGTLVPLVEGPWIEVTIHPFDGANCWVDLTGFNNPVDQALVVNSTHSSGSTFGFQGFGSGPFGGIGLVANDSLVAITAAIVGGSAIPVFAPPLPLVCTA